jgi:hypothetical protein
MGCRAWPFLGNREPHADRDLNYKSHRIIKHTIDPILPSTALSGPKQCHAHAAIDHQPRLDSLGRKSSEFETIVPDTAGGNSRTINPLGLLPNIFVTSLQDKGSANLCNDSVLIDMACFQLLGLKHTQVSLAKFSLGVEKLRPGPVGIVAVEQLIAFMRNSMS